MDWWCPWCEWLGSSGRGGPGSCPRCGTALVAIPRAVAVVAAVSVEGPALGSTSPITARPRSADPPSEHVEPAVRRTASRPRVLGSRRPVSIAAAALILVATGTAVAVHGPGGPPPAGWRPSTPRLPAMMAYLTSSFGKAMGGRVVVRAGNGRSRLEAPPTQAPARPSEAGAAPFAVRFGWSDDGSRAWVLDARGVLHLVPSGGRIVGPVLQAAFSPDGSALALCRGPTWPPRLEIVASGAPQRPLGPIVPGCDPRWSSDGTYVAYRTAIGSSPRERAPTFGVRNIRLRIDFAVSGRWPAAWAPGGGYVFSPLAAVSPAGDSVVLMDPRGGRRRTLVSAAVLQGLARDRPLGAITGLLWSADAAELAVSFGRSTDTGGGSLGAGSTLRGVAVVKPASGAGSFVATAGSVASMSWSRDGRLVAAIESTDGGPPWIAILHGTGPALTIRGVRGPSWSPDGRWVLGYVDGGWFALDAAHPERRLPLGWDSTQWAVARWCCPPIPVLTLDRAPIS